MGVNVRNCRRSLLVHSAFPACAVIGQVEILRRSEGDAARRAYRRRAKTIDTLHAKAPEEVSRTPDGSRKFHAARLETRVPGA